MADGAWHPSLGEIEAARLDGPNHARRPGPTLVGALVLSALALAVGIGALVWIESRTEPTTDDPATLVEDHAPAPAAGD